MAEETLHQCSLCYGPTGDINADCPKCNGTGWQAQRDDVGRYEAVKEAVNGQYTVIFVDECQEFTSEDFERMEAYLKARANAMEHFGKAIERQQRELPPPTIRDDTPVSFSKTTRRGQQPWHKDQRNQPWNKKKR